MKNLIMLLAAALLVAGATLPLWASCDLQGDVCSRWCGIRHYDSGIKAATCRAECVADRLGCLAAEGGMSK
jgi:hypothetical protein